MARYILIIKKIIIIKLANIFINNIILRYKSSKKIIFD